MAGTTFVRRWKDFDFIFVATLPMFLFSGTFYPITAYPPGLQLIVQSPRSTRAWRCSARCRSGWSGRGPWSTSAYLVVMGLIGLSIAWRRLDRVLLK